MYINKAIIYGNLTKDPELKALPTGNKVCNFALATNRTWKDQSGKSRNQ
jgi:single-strand DNA-binding protein